MASFVTSAVTCAAASDSETLTRRGRRPLQTGGLAAGWCSATACSYYDSREIYIEASYFPTLEARISRATGRYPRYFAPRDIARGNLRLLNTRIRIYRTAVPPPRGPPAKTPIRAPYRESVSELCRHHPPSTGDRPAAIP